MSVFFSETMNEISDIDDRKKFYNTYIKFGHECSICLEPVTTTLNAWKTECGHIFHKTCLIRYYDTALSKNFCCPYCREKLYGFEWWAFSVYDILSSNCDNYLDQVHYYELYTEMIPQNICEECDNIIGCTKNCFGCKDWRWSPTPNAFSRTKLTNKTGNE